MCNDYASFLCHTYLGEGKYDLFCKYLKYLIISIFIFSLVQHLGMKNIKFITFYRINTISFNKDKSHYRDQVSKEGKKKKANTSFTGKLTNLVSCPATY